MLRLITQRCLDTAYAEFAASPDKLGWLEDNMNRMQDLTPDFVAVLDKLPREGIRSASYLYRLIELSYDEQPPVVNRRHVEELTHRVAQESFLSDSMAVYGGCQPILAKHPTFLDTPPLMVLVYMAFDRASDDLPPRSR